MATPRPRPRPRPAQRSSSSAASKTEPANRNEELDREDSMFIRNQTRTVEQFKKLQEAFKEEPLTRRSPENDEPSSPQNDSHKHKKRSNKSAKGWQNEININRYLSHEVSSGGESDDEIQIVGGSSKGPSARRVSPGKRKRRSKSRSLTPPPEVSAYALAHARNVVRQAFNQPGRARSISPIPRDELADDYVTDPELRKIAEQTRKGLKSAEQTGNSEGAVLVRVTWVPHPQNKSDAAKQWAFKMNKKDSFREMFEHIATITTTKLDDLYVTYRDRRVYSSSSPSFLKMVDEVEELDACDRKTHEYVQQYKRSRSVSVIDSDAEEDPAVPAQSSVHSDDESEADLAKLTIILRCSKSPKHITLKVKSTTTCEAIVAAFVKQAGITANANTGRVSVDGDRMDPQTAIGEADVEDGDMIEVVGL